MKEQIKENLKNIGYTILCIYGFTVMLFTLYFEYLYAREHGFVNWIFFGFIIPALKGVIWPIIVLF